MCLTLVGNMKCKTVIYKSLLNALIMHHFTILSLKQSAPVNLFCQVDCLLKSNPFPTDFCHQCPITSISKQLKRSMHASQSGIMKTTGPELKKIRLLNLDH